MRSAVVAMGALALASAGGWAAAGAAEEFTIKDDTPAIAIEIVFDERVSSIPGLFEQLKADAEALAAEYRDNAEQDYAEWGQGGGWNQHQLSASYVLTYLTEDFASVLSTVNDYTGGAHGNEMLGTLTVDIASGDPVVPDVLFESFAPGSQAFTAIQAYARERLSFERARRLGIPDIPPEDLEWVLEGTEEPGDLANYTLIAGSDGRHASGIMLYFPPYQVGSFAEGSYTLEVPALVFEDYLAPEFQALFDAGT